MSVEVKLELGHKAAMKDKPTPEGFTHDWTVFVRGCEGSNIHHFVDKVVFHLHESFPKPKRVVKEPPYQVSESGYAGFIMPIELYFRSKEEPKKVRFEYDLFLRLEGSPVYNIRLEKLTFQNPSDDFRRKLLKARSERATSASGGGVSLPTAAIAPIQHSEDQRPVTHTKSTVGEKRPKSHASSKESAKPPPPPPAPAVKPSQPFENIFGAPIKAKNSPEPHVKIKEPSSFSSHQKPNKTLQPPPPPPNAVVKEPKTHRESPAAEPKEPKIKPPKVEKEQKSTTKRPLTPDGQTHHSSSSSSADKKRKHASSGSSEKAPDGPGKPEKSRSEKKDKPSKSKSSMSSSSSSSSLSGKKEKHKSSHSKSSSSNSTAGTNHKLSSPPEVFTAAQNLDSNGLKASVKSEDVKPVPHEAPVLSPVEKFRTLSPPPRDLDEFGSPLSSDENHSPPLHLVKEKLQNSGSSHHHPEVENGGTNHAYQERPPSQASVKPETITKPPKASSKTKKSPSKGHKVISGGSKHNSSNNSAVNNNSTTSSAVRENHSSPPLCGGPLSPKQVKTIDSAYHQELVELQKRIMSVSDQQQLQRIVDVIEKTGKFQITTSSFDFDLCSLDVSTVRQLKSCLSM